MLSIYIFILLILSYITLNNILKLFIRQKSPKTVKNLKYIKKIYNKKEKQDIEQLVAVRIIEPLLDLFNRKAKNFSIKNFEKKLLKAGIAKSPSRYLAYSLIISVVLMSAGYFSGFLLGSTMFMIMSIMLGPIVFVASIVDINQKIKKKNEKILLELPQFEKTILYQFKDGKPLIDAIKSYLPAATPEFYPELVTLIRDIEIYDDKTALEKFSDRISVAEVSNFCYALISGYQHGIDINQIISNQEIEIRRLNRDNIRKKIKRLPITMNAILILPIVCMLLIYGVTSIVYTFSTIKF